MALSTQANESTDWSETLPRVHFDVRQGSARSAGYALDAVDFLIGSVPGCDLRVGGDGPGVLCLLARHPAGVSLRKLAMAQAILVNGQSVALCELADGDRVQIGAVEIVCRIAPARAPTSPISLSNIEGSKDLDRAKREFQQTVLQFRQQVLLFQQEKEAWERQKQPTAQPFGPSAWDTQRAELQRELQDRKILLEERALEVEHQQRELTKVRTELADLRRQLYDHYQERRDRLAAMQEDVEKARHDLDDREKKLRLEEQDGAAGRQRDRARQEDIERRTVEVTQRAQRLEDERKLFEQRQCEGLEDWTTKNADLEAREKALADEARALPIKLKQYEADVLRLNRLAGDLERRETQLQQQSAEWSERHTTLQQASAESEEQLVQIDEWRAKLADEAERLGRQKKEQDEQHRQLAERTAALEGQQASLAVLRSRLERMREEMRAREQRLDDERARQETQSAELTRQQQEIDKQHAEMSADQRQYAQDRAQWVERSAIMETAIRRIKEAQEQLGVERERVQKEAAEVAERARHNADDDGVLQGRLAQVAEAQERLELERQALRERGVHLLEREQACQTLQEQLQRRTEEIAAGHKEITDRLQEYQTKFTELDERQKQLDARDTELNQQIETWRRELAEKTQLLQQRHVHVAGVEGEHQDQLNQLASQRQAFVEERAQFLLDQQAALEKIAQARTELESMRRDALAMIEQLPDAELRAGAAVERLSQAREQLRNHLGEVHQYVRQCQDELTQLRGRLQADLEKLNEQEQTLRQNQDEHRLAAAAFRQQLIDWQGQIAELKRLLARDETRLERREAQTDERAKAVEAEEKRLAEQAVNLVEQEQEVAERREEMDRHLVDMREWYRRKLRELAGVPLLPDTLRPEIEPTILPVSPPSPSGIGAEGEDAGDAADAAILPTKIGILSIGAADDSGDHQLGKALRDSQLIDADTLTALLAEARRQRRSLRQVLLASGVITLYQLALIEAGNVDGLMLGPVRVIDRLRHTAHEAVYRVFDPRRGAEAVLRHLSEADAGDAVKPDEFRQRFTQAKLNDPHLANTLEVLDLSGRPAVLQEWLTGLPALDWPPLAAAPGVCYRLLTQAAQGLAVAHQAGAIHGHLSDALLLLTGEGVLKICGFGEPPWLIGVQPDEEPTARDDLRTLGKIVSSWCTPTGVRKGAKTKPLPEALVSILYRLAAEGDAGYRDVKGLLEDLQSAAGAIPPNAEAWDRLVKYVREHGTAEAALRQSA